MSMMSLKKTKDALEPLAEKCMGKLPYHASFLPTKVNENGYVILTHSL